jgi:serine phosphatase RsbU (regulator of sigma subunit)
MAMWKQKLVLAFTLIVSLAVFLVLAQELDKLRNFTRMGDMWSLLLLRENEPSIFNEVDPLDFPEPPIPEPGDTLLTVEGLPATISNYFTVFNTHRAPGDTVSISFTSAGEAVESRVVTRSIPAGYRWLTQIILALRVLIVLGYLAIAYMGILKRKPSSTIRSLVMFSLAMAASLSVSWGSIAETYASFSLPDMLRILLYCFSILSWAFLLKLALVFPSDRPSFRKRILEAVMFLIPAALATTAFLAAGNEGNPRFTWFYVAYATVYCLLSLGILFRSSRKLEDPLERRQVRIVLMGALPGVIGQVGLLWFFTLVLPDQFTFTTRLIIGNVLFLLLALLPATFLYSIRRYRLMALEARIRRSTRFLAINLLLLTALIGVLWIFGEYVLASIRVRSQAPTLVLGLLLAMGFGPTQRRVRARLEERFFPEKVKLRILLRDFLASGMARSGVDEFWTELGFRLGEGLGTRQVVPVIKREGECVEPLTGKEAPFTSEDLFLRDLAVTGQPLPLNEILGSGRFDLTDEQILWFRTCSASLLIPLVTGEGMLGFVVVGEKTSGEDYTSDEMELLSALSGQMSLVVENLELLEERVRKEALEQQMDLARSVQKKLLPVSLPDVPGCSLAARIKPCLDVAGDYYDVFPLQGGRLLVAVGDVSGKGMGPALIMANLQASMRTALDAGLPLNTALERINRLVCSSTPDDMFITLFAGCFSPESSELLYVNAGHNPPMLFRRGEPVRLLTQGGMLLGVRSQENYELGSIECRPGDTLLLYTDGVTEVFDPGDEEYGEERLRNLVSSRLDESPEQILCSIENDVSTFQGGGDFQDDFTLLLMKKE